MRWDGYIDYNETRRAIELLQAPGEVFEVRVIGTASRKDIISGDFQDADTLFQKFDTIDLRKRNVYITLGEVREEYKSWCRYTGLDPEADNRRRHPEHFFYERLL